MSAIPQWEYRVVTVGNWLGMKPGALEAQLNELGQDGWEVVSTVHEPGGFKLVVVAKKPLTQTERRRRSQPHSAG